MTLDRNLAAATRGELNNNPGNIDYDPHVDWRGQLGIELVPPGETYAARFARFGTARDGIRAVAKILRSYIERDGCATTRRIIMRWAPPGDHNDTDAYVAAVARDCGLNPDQALACDAEDIAELTRAIIQHENGRVIYDDVLIADAVGAALA